MKKTGLLIFTLFAALHGFSQNVKNKAPVPTDTLQKLANAAGVKPTDILNNVANTPASSGLTYSALSQFMQSTVTTGTNGGFNFKTTLFGLKYLFSGTKKDSLSGYYLTHTRDRNTEISFGLNKASKTTDQLSTITAGYKISINHRDKSIVNFAKTLQALSKGIDLADYSVNVIADIYTGEIAATTLRSASLPPDKLQQALATVANSTKDKIAHPAAHYWSDNDFSGVLTTAGLDPSSKTFTDLVQKFDDGMGQVGDLQNTYTSGKDLPATAKRYKTIADSVFHKLGYSYSDLHKNLQNQYNTYAKKIDMGSLTTFSINPGYNIQNHHADTSTFNIRYLKGFGNYKKPWNVDLQVGVVSLRDSAATPADFGHNKLKFSAGLNKVFSVDDKSNPILESELAAEYDDVVSGRYKTERKEVFTGNLITTIHLSKEFSLPLTLKYDVKKPTLFGFLSVQWNLQDSGKSNSNTKN